MLDALSLVHLHKSKVHRTRHLSSIEALCNRAALCNSCSAEILRCLKFSDDLQNVTKVLLYTRCD